MQRTEIPESLTDADIREPHARPCRTIHESPAEALQQLSPMQRPEGTEPDSKYVNPMPKPEIPEPHAEAEEAPGVGNKADDRDLLVSEDPGDHGLLYRQQRGQTGLSV